MLPFAQAHVNHWYDLMADPVRKLDYDKDLFEGIANYGFRFLGKKFTPIAKLKTDIHELGHWLLVDNLQNLWYFSWNDDETIQIPLPPDNYAEYIPLVDQHKRRVRETLLGQVEGRLAYGQRPPRARAPLAKRVRRKGRS